MQVAFSQWTGISRDGSRRWRSRDPSFFPVLASYTTTVHLHMSLSLIRVSLSYPPMYNMQWGAFQHVICLQKIFYLVRIISILNTDSTIVFYMTRRAKLDPSCIYFEYIFTGSNLCVNLSFHIIEDVATILHIYKLLSYNRFYFYGNFYLICVTTYILYVQQLFQ